ncbi:hypothetical protein JTE90_024617 [Oedothorax gibbosus]|uniref:Lipase domain-containing protein n=1 Tax=Oedothorax gibbosus TaxID=931172 RepID=A0AAV6UGI2_9ARAC|nr:hypothetical protein JTE90_024617 [Oedothorax gibbosus]
MRKCLKILVFILVWTECTSYQSLIRDFFQNGLMGDFLATLPSRFQCVGTGKNNFTHFRAYTRNHPDQGRPLVAGDPSLLHDSDFDPALPTKVIVHGFVDNMHISDWMQRMKTRLLSLGEYNVILTDWSCGNDFPYFSAVQNSKITAGELKKLILFLQDSAGADPADFHLIGHSLGGHIAALVGHGVPHLGRISALDPAGPRFYDAPLEERLDPSDAQFVDAIHTDGGHGLLEGLGLRSQVGHVDFYPNGGKDQPGCHNSPFSILPRIGIHRAARYYMTCDHFRSIEYYIDSIQPPSGLSFGGRPSCQHIGVACLDWETYAQGRCADCTHAGDCAAMGYYSDEGVVKGPHISKHEYYMKTSEEEPYCLFQYQVIVETSCDPGHCVEDPEYSGPGINPGSIQIELKILGGKLARLQLDENIQYALKPGSQYVHLATSRFPLGELQGAKVWWGYSSKPDGPAPRAESPVGLGLKKIQVIPISLPETIRRFSMPAVTVLCGSPDRSIEKNQYLELTINEC